MILHWLSVMLGRLQGFFARHKWYGTPEAYIEDALEPREPVPPAVKESPTRWSDWELPTFFPPEREVTQANLDAQYPIYLPNEPLPDVQMPDPTVMPAIQLPSDISDALADTFKDRRGWTPLSSRVWRKQAILALTLVDGRTTTIGVTATFDGNEEARIVYVPIEDLERAQS